MVKGSIVLAAVLAALAANASAQEPDGVVVTASPFDNHDELEMAQPASVLRGERLRRRRAGTLGETLGAEPGVHSSAFGAGSARPIIRGLDAPRVRVMEGGMGTSDLSSVSPDHQVTGEPATARQIEVLRGPATLLYGSGAIGGLVNVVGNRIPGEPQEGVDGSAELRAVSGTGEAAGSFALNGGAHGFAWHAEGYKRASGDYRIPGAQNPADPASPRGRLPNSFTRTEGASLGGSWVGDRGYLGAGLQEIASRYGIPTPARSRIDLRQARTDVAGEMIDPLPGFSRARLKLRSSEYRHDEMEATGEIGTTFRNEAREGRFELTHAPLGGWTGVAGVQTEDKTVSALGPEAFLPRTRSRARGLFLVEDRSWRDFHFELGARAGSEARDPEGANPGRRFSLASFSAGTVWKFVPGYALAASLTSAERAPTAEELYSNGPHLATGSFEIGDPALGIERSRNLDLALRKSTGAWRGKLGVFFNRIGGFVFARNADRNGDGIADRVDENGALDPGGALLLVDYAQANARFRGFEAELSYRPQRSGFGARVFGDRAEGRLSGDGNLPRISPSRLGFEADWKRGPWSAYGMLLRVFRQDRVAALETGTPGYTRLDAGLEYAVKLPGGTAATLFLRGNNLLDRDMRVHTSFIKDFAPLPGRSIAAGLRAGF